MKKFITYMKNNPTVTRDYAKMRKYTPRYRESL